MVCKADPRMSRFEAEKQVRGLVRRKGIGRKVPLAKGLDHKDNQDVGKEVQRRMGLLDKGCTREDKEN